MTAFLDSDVLIDCLRGTREARRWLESNPSLPVRIPGIVAMELVVGSQDKTGLRRVRRLLRSFRVVWPEAKEFRLAYDLLTQHYLGSSIGIADCLIAAMSIQRSMRLYSFNLRHYRVVEGLDVVAPYARAR